ncbi:MmgE/PrpD family protein [Altererythrobacter sp. BO-6]|uniref:MmgE/PrpD family protein n=1 Tax=Altererythrobacter sp. BO-6 TaxID=2604537 RepID=UPI0013E1C820|nr:MmgE/PrpD family protein [Altererythrobacter sp. BO-6]QIG54563.1 MmgE/PrpD family protein [Altererythrobacter sp. BO-6]
MLANPAPATSPATGGTAAGAGAPPPPASDAIVAVADYMLGLRYEAISSAVLQVTRTELFGAVSVGLGGRNEDGMRQLRELASELGGKGEAVIWGSPLRVPAHDAVRINAAMVHSLEFDDTFGCGFLHPSAITFPAAFAVDDMVGGISGREFLAASTAAIDVACRLSIASQPGVDGFTAGWHNTTMIGYLSTALLAARLMKLSDEQTINAVGIAYHQAAGNSQSHIDSALTKRLGPGFASSAGVLAARLAAKGVSGPAGVLEGKKGWWQQYHKGNYSRALMFDGLGRDFPAMEMPSIPTFMAIRLPRAMPRFPPRATGKAWGPAMADHFRRPSRACTAGISRTSPMSR